MRETPRFHPEQPSDHEQSPKQKEWENAAAIVETITDGLGKGIEEGIKESVVALHVHGISTIQSCEGHPHIEEKGQEPFPWVEVQTPEPEDWQENEVSREAWAKANREQEEKLQALLDEFYRDRESSPDARLIFSPRGVFGAFLIHSVGGEEMRSAALEEQRKVHARYKQEMDDFQEFLKKRFLGGHPS